jgi:hypothetical protein
MVTEALAEVDELIAAADTTMSGGWYNFACVHALASGTVAGKKQEYADRAMELLTTAVKAGWKNAAHMAKDADLDPLRDRDDFRRLLAALPAPEPKARELAPPPRPAR